MLAYVAFLSMVSLESGRIVRVRSEFDAAISQTFTEDFAQIPVADHSDRGLAQTHFDSETMWDSKTGWVRPGAVYQSGTGIAFFGRTNYFPAKGVLSYVPPITVHFKERVTAIGADFLGADNQTVPLAIEAIGENSWPLLSITLDCPRAGFTFVGFVANQPIRMLKVTKLGQATVPTRLGRITAGVTLPRPISGGG